MYWQRQGLCSLILVQQIAVGGLDEVIALTQGLSCTGLQLTALATCAALANSSTSTAQSAMLVQDNGFIFQLGILLGE